MIIVGTTSVIFYINVIYFNICYKYTLFDLVMASDVVCLIADIYDNVKNMIE